MTSTYEKPFLDVDSQVDLLEDRGLVFNDRELVYRELQAIGYYRLSGYWYPFRRPQPAEGEPRPSDFVDGTTLNEILAIYHFDESLRAEVLNALSHIEVAMRFRIGHLLGRRGPFAHNEPSALDPSWIEPRKRKSTGPNCSDECTREESEHDEWMGKQTRNEEVSNEAFIAHFHSQYGKPAPVWVATEVMTLGDLTRLFNGLTQRDRQQVAADFDVYQDDGNGDAHAFSSWLEHLRQTRNYCAHHARLWNRNHTAPLSVPTTVSEMGHLRGVEDAETGARTVSRAASRVYGTLVLITYLLTRINRSNYVRDRIRSLLEEFAGGSPGRWGSMGFPEGWEDRAIWQPGYSRDEKLTQQASMIRDLHLLYTADAAALLTHKENHKQRLSRLGFYRKKGAALSVPGAEAHRYPAFQFDPETGDLSPLAIVANRRLLDGDPSSAGRRWHALNWWTTASEELVGGLSPMKALETGSLTRAAVDNLLDPIEDE